jgi:signal transduction histidine kinase
MEAEATRTSRWQQTWHLAAGLGPPVLLLGLSLAALLYALFTRMESYQQAGREALREWLDEARVYRKTLPELIRDYLDAAASPPAQDGDLDRRAEEIEAHLAALGKPTRLFSEQLPLFPVIYDLRVDLPGRTILWDSRLPRPVSGKPLSELRYQPLGARDERAVVHVTYQLHAYNRQQEEEARQQQLLLWVGMAASGGIVVCAAWVWLYLRHQRRRQIAALLARQQVEHAQRIALENALQREEAERRHSEAQRELLQQRLAAQEAERRALQIESQVFASVGVMAASYAHNIKNLLVRPNDLLRRCQESPSLDAPTRRMLSDVADILSNATERLDLILKTVRRDPRRAEATLVDLNPLVAQTHRAWSEIADQQWKADLQLVLHADPLTVRCDPSHLIQVLENLLFNARDAIYEMRNYKREQARSDPSLSEEQKRQNLILATGWRGTIVLRTGRADGEALVEVQDDGIGMSQEVQQRCTELHFTTKAGNALYQGLATGLGLGLAFVRTIVEGYGGKLEIQTAPRAGSCMRLRLPICQNQAPDA